MKSVIGEVLPGMVEILGEELEAQLGETLPLLVLVQSSEGVHCCSNMGEEDRIEALEQLLHGWKVDREKSKRPVAAVLPSARLLQ